MADAFSSASGWANLAQGNWVPEIYSQNVLMFFRRAAVAEAITNTDYYGEIAALGDTVKIIKEPVITVADYVRGQSLQTQALDDDQDTLLVDQGKYFQFAVDDIEKKQAHLNWESLSTSSAAYALKNSYDAAILDFIETSSTTNVFGTDAGIGSGAIDLGYAAGETSPLQVMNRLCRLLDDDDVPEEGRWFVASPEFWEVMGDENSKLMGVDFTGDVNSKMRNGRITDGLIRGFHCYKTNNAPAPGSGTTTANAALAGHMSAIATASQIAEIESLRSEDFFGDKVRGLHVYGRKSLRETALAKCFWLTD